jgi:hypothetical protein
LSLAIRRDIRRPPVFVQVYGCTNGRSNWLQSFFPKRILLAHRPIRALMRWKHASTDILGI